MARLPKPGGDNGNWGNVLNEFLEVSHDGDGTIKPGAISDSHIISISQNKVTGLGANLAGKADDNSVVHVSGNETVAGIKTFTSSPVVPTPTASSQVANKSYVDTAINLVSSAMPSVTMKIKAVATGQTYSRLIPLYNDNGVWTVDEMMTVQIHAEEAAPEDLPRDILQVALSMKEVIASGLYGMYFSTVALDVMAGSSGDVIALSKTGVSLMESYGDMTVSWAGVSEASSLNWFTSSPDGLTIQSNVSNMLKYVGTLRIKGTLNYTSGN